MSSASPPLLAAQTLTSPRRTLYKDALKNGFYTMLAARDSYRDATAQEGGMHIDLVLRFIEVQALLLTPIAPHVAEHLWCSLLEHKTTIQVAQFPKIDAPVDHAILDGAAFVRTTLKEIRDAEIGFAKKKGKGKTIALFDPSKPKGIKVYVASGFPEWQDNAVAVIKNAYNPATLAIDDAQIKEELTSKGYLKEKKMMPFVALFKVRCFFLSVEPLLTFLWRVCSARSASSALTSRSTGRHSSTRRRRSRSRSPTSSASSASRRSTSCPSPRPRPTSLGTRS